ncbi:hypothetical protein IJE86_01430 [bacterium]|nr:hypothetical protein [bacterium]
MGILEFIFGIIIVVAVLFLAVAIWGIKYNYLELEENKKLREDLRKARLRRVKNEYKNAKEVK